LYGTAQVLLLAAALWSWTGYWYLWLIFFQSYAGRLNPAAEFEPYALYVVLALLAVAVPALRGWAWSRRRARRRQSVPDVGGAALTAD
jgi:hypothetical protein